MVDYSYMKTALKNKYTYIIGIPLGLLGVGLPFAVWAIVKACGYDAFPYYILHASIAFIFYMVGLLIADIGEVKYCKKNDIVLASSVPVEVHQKFINKRTPFFLAGFMTVITLAVLAIIFVFAQKWPLLP